MNDAARVPVMEELPESEATGEISVIYEEVRRLCGVPYVSSMHRYLATSPGRLEWVWEALRPAMVSGAIQEAAWECVNALSLTPMAPLSRSALRLFGVAAVDETAIRAACETFIRVSPINLIFGACLRQILTEAQEPADAAPVVEWSPPEPYENLPGFVDSDGLSEAHAAVLATFTRPLGAGKFIPGPYRMFAKWPAYLAHVAVELPRFWLAPDTRMIGRPCSPLSPPPRQRSWRDCQKSLKVSRLAMTLRSYAPLRRRTGKPAPRWL